MKRLLVVILGVTLAPLVVAAGKDSLWEITARMEMPGMPAEMRGMTIPGFGAPQKQTMCLAEGKKYESEKQKDCKVIDQKQSGRITRMTIQCKEGTMKMEREEVSKDHWRLKMEMSSDGQQMTMFEEAKRIGGCDADKEGNMSRETQVVLGDMKGQADANAAQIGKECQQALTNWPASPQVFTTYEQMAKARRDALANAKGNRDAVRMVDSTQPDIPACAKARAGYCVKAKAAFGEAKTRQGYAGLLQRGKAGEVRAALAYCGNDLAPVVARHCKAALSDADYPFIAAHCPAERKTLAAQHCAGRSYTAVEAKYRALCGGGSGGDDNVAAGDGSSPLQGVGEKGADAVGQGVKKLKGLFGF